MQRENGKHLAGGKPKLKQRKPKQRKPKKPSIFNKQQKCLLAIAIVLAVALVGVVGYKKTFVRPELPDKTNPTNNPEKPIAEIDYGEGVRPRADGERKSEDYYTVLILGRDTGGGGNTDTMLLASYDVTNQKAAVMSIPRDTMVNVNWDVKKINSVYGWNGGGDKGLQALYKEISQLVGFEPDYQVIVEWEAVGKIVDAIGGVYFDVPYDMDYHDPYQDLVIEQAKGYRLLSGEDAMQVIRWRKNDKDSPYGNVQIGDDGRMGVQQDFLKAVIKQLLTPANIKNIGKIATVFQESVTTDLSFQEILWFGKQAVSGGLGVDSVEFMTMPFKYANGYSRTYSSEFGRPFYLSYVVPDANQLLDIVNHKLSPFSEPFGKSDLDIMYVNSDGSVGSTTGYVEDKPAAQPPDLSKFETKEPTEEVVVDENGNIVDPETGEVMEEIPEIIDPENPGTEVLPENGEGADPVDPEETEDTPIFPEEEPGITDEPIDVGPAPGEEGSYVPPEEPDVPAEPEIME
jgi:LCP family protein required for cell wall assembly